jgi:hypothetical protein
MNEINVETDKEFRDKALQITNYFFNYLNNIDPYTFVKKHLKSKFIQFPDYAELIFDDLIKDRKNLSFRIKIEKRNLISMDRHGSIHKEEENGKFILTIYISPTDLRNYSIFGVYKFENLLDDVLEVLIKSKKDFKTVLYHETIHYLDYMRFKKKKDSGSLHYSKKLNYYLRSLETNAYFQSLVLKLQNALNGKKMYIKSLLSSPNLLKEIITNHNFYKIEKEEALFDFIEFFSMDDIGLLGLTKKQEHLYIKNRNKITFRLHQNIKMLDI